MISESTVSVEQQITASHDTVINKSTEMTVELKVVLRHNPGIYLEGLRNTMTKHCQNSRSLESRSEPGTSWIRNLKGRHLLRDINGGSIISEHSPQYASWRCGTGYLVDTNQYYVGSPWR